MSDQKEKFRTNFSEEELDHFKEKLESLKSETKEEIERLKNSSDSIDSNADDRKSGVDHHPGDVASDTQMKKTTYTLLEKEREKMKKIDAALERIDSGTYGICLVSGKQIEKERLEAIPYAMHAVDAKEQK